MTISGMVTEVRKEERTKGAKVYLNTKVVIEGLILSLGYRVAAPSENSEIKASVQTLWHKGTGAKGSTGEKGRAWASYQIVSWVPVHS